MENPHNERQAILLQRIVKSVVRPRSLLCPRKPFRSNPISSQTKCNDIFQELNQCLEVRRCLSSLALHLHSNAEPNFLVFHPKRNMKRSHSTSDPPISSKQRHLLCMCFPSIDSPGNRPGERRNQIGRRSRLKVQEKCSVQHRSLARQRCSPIQLHRRR